MSESPAPINTTVGPNTLLTSPEAARYSRLSEGHLRNLRMWGIGPAFIKVGRAVRYRRAAIDAWLAERECQSTVEV